MGFNKTLGGSDSHGGRYLKKRLASAALSTRLALPTDLELPNNTCIDVSTNCYRLPERDSKSPRVSPDQIELTVDIRSHRNYSMWRSSQNLSLHRCSFLICGGEQTQLVATVAIVEALNFAFWD
jgi:hypothetical protein